MAQFKRMDEYVGQRKDNPYPSDYQNPQLKLEKEYYLMYCRAMLADFTNNICELPYAFGKNKRTFKELHEYATGSYPNTKLKENLLGKTKKKNGKFITKMNISWDTLPVISKMLDVMQEKNMRQDYDVDAYCIDDDSIQAKEGDRAMLKYLVQADVVEFMQRTKFVPATKMNPQQMGIITENDVDLYFETGAYTFQREIASIAACNKTKLISGYKVIQDGTFGDLIKYGIGLWKNEIDPTTGTVKIRKCDVYNPELDRCSMVLPYSSSNNFDNLSKCAELRTMTIADLRKECPWMSADQLIYAATCYQYMNPEFGGLITSVQAQLNSSNGYNLDPINRCKILVLDAQWLGVDIENYIKNDKRNLYKSVDFDYKVTSDMGRKGDKLKQKKVVKKFGAKWVIGTEILLKYGLSEDIVYYGPDGDRCPSLDYFATKTGSISLIERCIAIQDDIDLANIKLRNALATAVPAPRMVIQTGLLDNVFLNNIKQQPEDNFATFRELGYLMVNAVDDEGKPIFTNQKLVDFLPMGIQEDINVFTGQILAGINNLREVLGIPQGVDGSTPNPYNGARKTELSMQSSNAALFPTFNCFQYLFEAAFTDVVKKWQIIAKDRNIKVNYSPLGQKNMKVLSLDPDFVNADFNIALTIGASDQELQQLTADISQMKALGIQTSFQQGITTSEYLYLTETLKSGNIKQAMWVMAKIEQKKIAAQQAIDQQNQQNNVASQQNSAAQAELNKQQTVGIEGTQNRLTIRLKAAEDRKTAAVSGALKAFDKEGGPSAMPLYNSIMADANTEIASIMANDPNNQQGQQQGAPDPSQQQPGQPQLPQQQPDPSQDQQQQVA